MTTHYTKAPERTPLVLMDRVYGVDRILINQSSIASITYEVWAYPSREDACDDRNGEEVGEADELDVEDCVFDELQTDPPWNSDRDADGYNLRFTLPGSRRPNGRAWHRVQLWLTPAEPDGAEAFPIVWIVETTALAGNS